MPQPPKKRMAPAADQDHANASNDNPILSVASDKHSDAVLGLPGVHVVLVTTSAGRTRRRVLFGLPAAQRAVDRATAAGHEATIVLCRLIPTGGEL